MSYIACFLYICFIYSFYLHYYVMIFTVLLGVPIPERFIHQPLTLFSKCHVEQWKCQCSQDVACQSPRRVNRHSPNNARVFRHKSALPPILLNFVIEEIKLWIVAGAKKLRVLVS